MPVKEKEIEKRYYSIGEVAKMFNVSTSLIRFWENEFDIIQPKKNHKGTRSFTKKDIEHLKIIQHLIKEKRYTHEGAKKQLRSSKDDTVKKLKVVESLQEIKAFLLAMKKNI